MKPTGNSNNGLILKVLHHQKPLTKVGDFILLRADDSIPADIAIIATSEPDCVCYIETKNLDGETNLKIRRGVTELSHLKSPTDCLETKCFLDVEAPNELMYSFSAALRINPATYDLPRLSVANRQSTDRKQPQTPRDKGGVLVPININGVLLRGCMLRNTDWVIGIIVYTGDDTKLMRNSGITPSKRSRIDRQLNPQVHIILILLTQDFVELYDFIRFIIHLWYSRSYLSGSISILYRTFRSRNGC